MFATADLPVPGNCFQFHVLFNGTVFSYMNIENGVCE